MIDKQLSVGMTMPASLCYDTAMIQPLQDDAQFAQIRQDSARQPVFLLKHSTRCPISAAASEQFRRFAEILPDVACWQVLVIEQRPLSLAIAQETGIPHASPQALLFVDGNVVWHASHYEITTRAMQEAYLASKQ